MFKKLRSRLTVIFVSLTVAPLILVSVITGVRIYNTEVNHSIESQRLLNGRFGQAIGDIMNERIDELSFLGQVYGIDQLDLEKQHDLLSGLLLEHEAYNEIAIINPDGKERVRVLRLRAVTDEDLRDRSADALFQDVVASGEVRFSDVHTDTSNGEPLLTIAVPLYNLRTGELSSVIYGDFRFRLVWDLVATLQADVKGALEVFLLDSSGNVIAHANPTIVLRGTQFEIPSEDGQAIGLDGESSFVTSQTLPIANQTFVIVGEEPTSTALRPAINTLISTAVIVLAGILIAIAVVALVVRQIVRPVEQLSKTAQTIRDGNLDMRTTVNRDDEIGILAHSFNDMTARLQDLIRNLEVRVRERTRDLQIASDVSRQVTKVLDIDKLLPDLAEQTRAGFELYHVSVFLYESEEDMLNLAASTGKADNSMMLEGKHFNIQDQGLVPLAARERQLVLMNDVTASADHLSNPLLPETASELALPMQVGEKLIGVLDLQSQQRDRFTDSDLQVLTTLAEQIAIAVQNAQLYKETEEARGEAEKANNIKSQFLASVSHELRTPMNAILNFTKFVLSGRMGEINERQTNALNNVILSGDHLLNLINDVLDISKIESGSLALFVQPNIDLKQELQDIHNLAQSLIRDKPIDLKLDVSDDLPTITGDRQRIRQIVLNLVSNACKFTEKGQIVLSAAQREAVILISVKDTGPGINEADHMKIFEVFTQAESGLRSGQGTGLGLPISKRLAEAHGGTIWLESTLGKGAQFFVSLPVQSALEPTLALNA